MSIVNMKQPVPFYCCGCVTSRLLGSLRMDRDHSRVLSVKLRLPALGLVTVALCWLVERAMLMQSDSSVQMNAVRLI